MSERVFIIDVDELRPPSTLLGQFLSQVAKRSSDIDTQMLGDTDVSTFLAIVRNQAAWHHPSAEAALAHMGHSEAFEGAVAHMEDAHRLLPENLHKLHAALGDTAIHTGKKLPEQHLSDAKLLANAGMTFDPPLLDPETSPLSKTLPRLRLDVTPDQ